MTRRLRLVRATLGYEGGLVLHTATSGPVPTLAEIRLVAEEDGRIVALGATRTNIAYLSGLAPEVIEAAILDAAEAIDWSLPWDDVVPALDRLRPDLVAPARMLFEMAAADGRARAAGVTLARLLGATGASQGSPTNQTLFWQEDASLLARARLYVGRGFRDLKLRIGIGDFAGDLARLRLLRDTFGSDLRLSVDANGRWSVSEARDRLAALAAIGLDYVEQPLPADAWRETAALSEVSPIPLMLDEALGSMAAVRRLAETRAAPLAHLKLAKLGGLDRLAEAARLLEGSGIGIMVGQMNEGAVSTAAIAQAAIALEAPFRELYGADGITGDVAGPPLRYADGLVHLPDGPGIGIDTYRIDDSTSVLWDHTA